MHSRRGPAFPRWLLQLRTDVLTSVCIDKGDQRMSDPHMSDPQALPESLHQDYRARVIDAANNRLETLPPWLGGFAASLNRLVLSGNQLAALPAELGQLSQLKTLLLDNNRLRLLPAAAMSLPRLELLDVSHNRLETLPAAVSQLTSLKQLRAQNNSLGVLAPQLGGCAALEELNVSSNSLKVSRTTFLRADRLGERPLHHEGAAFSAHAAAKQ